jgi:hypothetical protein
MSETTQFIRSQNSRVLLVSHRYRMMRAFNSCLHELEDVVREIDDVDFFAPKDGYLFSQKITKLVKGVTGSIELANLLSPAPNSHVLDREYDLLFVNFSDPGYYYLLNSLKGWRKKCRKVVCYVTEVWQRDLPQWKSLLKLYNDFDYIFVGHISILDEMEKITGRPCIYLPAAVDTVRFCPYPHKPMRGIDVSNIGRRSAVTHQALLEMADRGEIFYYYDTLSKANVNNHQEHRSLFRNILKRSRYFIANKAKADRSNQTQGQLEVGYRFFEGVASGAVTIGDAPDNEAFRKRNLTNSLLRHDWGYRWQEILKAAGLEPTDRAIARNEQLKLLAEQVQQG